MKAASAIGFGPEWQRALGDALGEVSSRLDGAAVDLAVVFAAHQYASNYPDMLAEIRARLDPRVLIGCSGQGVIGTDREVERTAAISVLAFSLPGAQLSPHHVTQAELAEDSGAWAASLGVPLTDANAWLIIADPFTIDPELLMSTLTMTYPDTPLIGGLASGHPRMRGTHVFLEGTAHAYGAVALAIGGPYTVQPVVSQGAEPIGETWTITGAHDNVVESLGMRPALEILSETFQALPEYTQQRARSNLLVGLAMNEYQDDFGRGDFLIRNLLGINQENGELVIGAAPRVGQTLQFQLRDPDAADAELAFLLERTRFELEGRQAVGGLLFACNGRGIGLFGQPDHDAQAVTNHLGEIPLAGFFCNGEIGPVAGKPFLHGFTASLALIVPKE